MIGKKTSGAVFLIKGECNIIIPAFQQSLRHITEYNL